MPRVARIVVPGIAHHVTQRGNNRQQAFFCDQDRELYPALLKAEAERFGLEILGYCLMNSGQSPINRNSGQSPIN